MNVNIRIEKVDLVAAPRTYIERRLRLSLGRFSGRWASSGPASQI